MNCKLTLLFLLFSLSAIAQKTVEIQVFDTENTALSYATVLLKGTSFGKTTDNDGKVVFKNLPFGEYQLVVSYLGYLKYEQMISIQESSTATFTAQLLKGVDILNEVVITGTQRENRVSESPIKVEILSAKLFQKNPTPNLFQAVEMVNGVKPQLNCNVCNTGDIHINGMEGGYTMILIDGMPIVSGLSTVYGLMGIPNSITDRIEIVKGPASALYGSEAMAGIINVITKNPLENAGQITLEVQGTTWSELTLDGSISVKVGKNIGTLISGNYYKFNQIIDNNNDGFTDLTLQDRFSIFNKWQIKRPENRAATLALRYMQENRWGGETDWTEAFRGTDEIYGESIYTKRFETILNYQLPTKQKVFFQASYNYHDQNSVYGDMPFIAQQHIAFGQLFLEKDLSPTLHLMTGTALRYNYYNDNTPATATADEQFFPGLFAQTEWKPNDRNNLLVGLRYDYNVNHGNIVSPRIAYRFDANKNNQFRVNLGTGFRTVYIFTEDHAALSGARDVIITEDLNPERSFNSILNYILKIPSNNHYLSVDFSAFYNYFTNKIVGDFDEDPNQIIYSNLNGNAITRGLAFNIDYTNAFPLKVNVGLTLMDVFLNQENENGVLERTDQLFASKWSGNYLVSYTAAPIALTFDLTGSFYGPMRLPIFPNDFRPEYSSAFTIMNLKVSKKLPYGINLYAGVRNILNFVPDNPILRPEDPFDRNVDNPITNPNDYAFDPTYNYASLQGINGFFGVVWNLK
ncbi:MAG: outer membrane receptor for ferrienterochelin and colicins [Saprospiraceae bacterium]|jgi:outer membrane receptor for ferrienterochelin and colicins